MTIDDIFSSPWIWAMPTLLGIFAIWLFIDTIFLIRWYRREEEKNENDFKDK
jgi:hypothetical protein